MERFLRTSIGLLLGLSCIIACCGMISPATAGYKVIYSFCAQANCADGKTPNVGVIRDAEGRLYGVTFLGGAHDQGAIFELTRKGSKWTEKVLYSFCSEANCADGANPDAPLIMDTSGDLYGVVPNGGPHGVGNIFELVPNAKRTKWTFHLLYGFCDVQTPDCVSGISAIGGLSYLGMSTGTRYDGVSPLYGTTQFGGQYGQGLVYQLVPKNGNWMLSPIYNFCSAGLPCIDGSELATSVLVKDASTILGTAAGGGANNGGVVFKLTRHPTAMKSDWKETVLYSFCGLSNCADGYYPASQPLLDDQGNIFGTTPNGGAATWECVDGFDCGVLFELSPDGIESVLHAFCSQKNCGDGGGPEGSLTTDGSGAFYGTTIGIDEPGTLFKYDGSLTVLHRFCGKGGCPDGSEPYNVTLATDDAGDMFGTTRSGGDFGNGVVFAWTP